MATLPGRLENLAAWLAARATAVAAGAIIFALAVITADHYLGLAGGLSHRWLRSAGKGLGEAGGGLALVAVAYYLGRETFAAALRRGAVGPVAAGPLKTVLRLLRLTHPLAGAATAAAAALHGYLLWSGRLPAGETVGLAALAGLALLSVTGFLLAGGSRGAGLRAGHRLAGLAFLLLYALHKLTAD